MQIAFDYSYSSNNLKRQDSKGLVSLDDAWIRKRVSPRSGFVRFLLCWNWKFKFPFLFPLFLHADEVFHASVTLRPGAISKTNKTALFTIIRYQISYQIINLMALLVVVQVLIMQGQNDKRIRYRYRYR